jgi:hypothetical protein
MVQVAQPQREKEFSPQLTARVRVHHSDEAATLSSPS